MSDDVIFQSGLFIMAIVWGGGLMLAYDCLRLLRMFVTHRKWVQAMEELIFWLAASFIIYICIYRYNSGAVRNYVVFGMAVGMFFYRYCLSAWFIRAACFILRPIRNGLRIFKTFMKNIGKRLKSAAAGVKIKIKDTAHRKAGKQEETDGR